MTVAEVAALWVARLQSSDATDAERRACTAWQAQSPANAAAYAELEALWGTLGAVPLAPRRPRAAVAGAALVVLALGVAAGPEVAVRLRADAVAPVGEIVHMTLPDGSRLDLDSGTAVALRFDGRARRVEILRGRAFAEVTPDPSRPFTLEAGHLVARAVGTHYGASDKAVTVTEGTVEARWPEGTVTLHAGEAADLVSGRLETARADPAARAWRDGRLVVSGRPLAEVLDELSGYRRGHILLLDRAAGARPVSGVFDLADTDGALDMLAASLGLRLTRVPGLVVLR